MMFTGADSLESSGIVPGCGNTIRDDAASRKPMVLHARTVTGTGGGPDKTIINSPRFLSALGFDCLCLFYHPANDQKFNAIRQRARGIGVSVLEMDDNSFLDLARIRRTIQICRDYQVDIWHGHDYKTNLLGLIVSKFHKMRLITTAHGWVDFSGRLPLYYKYEKRWILPRYERVICVSETVMEQAIAGGTPASKCTLLDNAIDCEQFKRIRAIPTAKKNDFGVDSQEVIIGSIGRLSKEKGFDLLITAVAKLIRQGRSLRLFIAGEGPESDQLHRQIVSMGLQEHVKLIGFVQDTRAFLECLDVFVLSSHREGLPNVVLEAMSVGAPVVATAVDGVPKIITNEMDGTLVVPGSDQEIADAIVSLLENPEKRKRFSEAARQTITTKWSFASRMNKVASIYSS